MGTQTPTQVAGSDKWLRTRAPLNQVPLPLSLATHNSLTHPPSHSPIPPTCQPPAKPPVPEKEGTVYRLHNREERPVGVVCCLCGQECGLKSIQWHFQKCLIKWDRRRYTPPLSMQNNSSFGCIHLHPSLPLRGLPTVMELFDPRGIPTEPGPDLEAYNKQARDVYADEVGPSF